MTRRQFQDKRDREVQRDLLSIGVLQCTLKTGQKQTKVEALILLMKECFADQPHVVAQIDKVAERMYQPIPENLT